jgi:hypothetical protein
MNETIKLLVVTGVLAVGGIGLLIYNNSEEGKNIPKKKYGGRKNEIEDEGRLSDSDESVSLSDSDDSLSVSEESLSDSDEDYDSEKNENENENDKSWLDLRSYFGNKEEYVPKHKEKETRPKTINKKKETIKHKERNNKTKRKKQ